MSDGGGRIPRWLKWLGQVFRHPGQFLSHFAGLRHWSERSTIALVMQTHDNSLTLYPSRGLFGRFKLRSRQGHGLPNPTWIPAANEACRRIAKHIDGFPLGSVGDILDIPMTAHFLGGCPIGDSRRHGRHRPLPPTLRPPRPARRRRRSDLRQPRRQPVADDHRPGRARDGDVAQQRRPRPAPAARRRLPAPRTGRATHPVRAPGGTGGPAPGRRQGVRQAAGYEIPGSVTVVRTGESHGSRRSCCGLPANTAPSAPSNSGPGD